MLMERFVRRALPMCSSREDAEMATLGLMGTKGRVEARPSSSSSLSGTYLLFTDAGMVSDGRRARGDGPGHAAIGVVLKKPNLMTFDQISRAIGPATHNEAEYTALIEGLTLSLRLGVRRIRAFTDSELVVDQ